MIIIYHLDIPKILVNNSSFATYNNAQIFNRL